MPKNAATPNQLRRYFTHIINSSAPDALKALARAQLEKIDAGHKVNFDSGANDRLADAISELLGTLACHLDFMRLLHGEPVRQTRHLRPNLAAALREKARRLGRAPVGADFPADHPVHAFALAYWGGVAAWSADSAERAQHAKGFWDCRRNQIDTLRAASGRFPDVPVTHALLRLAGLHRLAVLLNAEQLALLAKEAGVDRKLIHRADGWWTRDRVVDAYAAECRAAGVTLSSSGLAARGGEASSLRAYAARHFGSFRAFQAAVTERHPDIKAPVGPVAADGTRLDSQSEVVAYEAILAALPQATIKVHVVLPGEPSRSARSGDFLVDGRVWIEVLGLSRDSMPFATSSRQRKYAAQWASKLARYAEVGVQPVVIEPADIQDKQRLAERVGEIMQRLGQAPPRALDHTSRTVRAKGSWTFEALCQAVAEVAAMTGMMPTYRALTAVGYGHAAQMLRQPGARQQVATALGLRDKHRKGVWTRMRVVEELAAVVREHGAVPTRAKLRRAGHGRLCSAAGRLWGGDQTGLQAAVERLAGMSLTPRRATNGSFTTRAQLVAALKPLADELGRMPTCREATEAGVSTAWSRASRTVGVAAAARLLGVRSVRPPRRPDLPHKALP